MEKRTAMGMAGGLILILSGQLAVAASTSCEASLTSQRDGNVVITGHSDAVGAVYAQVVGPSGRLQRFYLMTDPIQPGQELPGYGSFAGIADFAVEPGIAYQTMYLDQKGRVLCVATMRLDEKVLVLRLLESRGLLEDDVTVAGDAEDTGTLGNTGDYRPGPARWPEGAGRH